MEQTIEQQYTLPFRLEEVSKYIEQCKEGLISMHQLMYYVNKYLRTEEERSLVMDAIHELQEA